MIAGRDVARAILAVVFIVLFFMIVFGGYTPSAPGGDIDKCDGPRQRAYQINGEIIACINN